MDVSRATWFGARAHPDGVMTGRYTNSTLPSLTRAVVRLSRTSARSVLESLARLAARRSDPRGRAVRRDIPRLLHTFQGGFSAHHERTDAEFVALGKSLQALFNIAQELAALVGERLGAMRNALNESRIGGPDGMAVASLQDLRDGLAEAAAELAALQAVGGGLGRVHALVRNIERVGQSLRASVFGFAVESARTEQSQQTFGAFVVELRALGDKITRVAEMVGQQTGVTRSTQEREWTALSTSHAQLCELSKKLEITAGATATETQGMLDQVLQGLQQAEERMRQTTRHAGEAVFYLQFGDIIRQKTEHIAETLRETAETLNPTVPRRDFPARAAAADGVLAIQIGQLELIRTEVEAAQRKLSESFQSLAEETEQIRETLGLWRSRPQPTHHQGGSDSLGAFKADIVRLENLHRLGHDLRLEARRSTQSAGAVSRQLAGHVGEVKALNADIHLQALNAIVKTAVLGDAGATLSVLSMHVDSLYAESRGVVADLVAVLETVLEQSGGHASRESLAEEAIRNTRLHSGMEKIESAFDECRATFDSADKLVERQRDALDGSQALLGSLVHHGSAIEAQIRELTAFRAMLAPWAAAQNASAPGTATLSHRYTMQSEREIHERAGRSVDAGSSSQAAADDNPELFEEPLPKSEVAIQTRSGPTPTTPDRGTPIAAAVPPPVSELGDNVDLF